MLLRFFVILFVVITSLPIIAQDDSFTADRPGATTGTGIIAKGRLQWETGAAYERDRTAEPAEHNYTLNTSLWRLGLSSRIELRVQTDAYLTHFSNTSDFTFSKSGRCWGNLGFGTKLRLIDEHGLLPSMALLGNVSVPCGKKYETAHRDFGFQLHVLFENTISKRWGLGYDVGLDRSDDGSGCSMFLGVCLSFQATDRLGLFAEQYNSLGDDSSSWLETGMSYQLAQRLQLDASVDLNLNHPSRLFIISFGVAWQIN